MIMQQKLFIILLRCSKSLITPDIKDQLKPFSPFKIIQGLILPYFQYHRCIELTKLHVMLMLGMIIVLKAIIIRYITELLLSKTIN